MTHSLSVQGLSWTLCLGVSGERFPLIKAKMSFCFPGLLGTQGDVNESLQEWTWLFFMRLITGHNLNISYIWNISIWWYGQQVIPKPTWFCSMNSRCWHTSCLDLGNKVGVSETPTALGIGQNKLAKTNVNRTQAASGENSNSLHIKPHFYESSSFQAGLNRTSVFTSWDEPLAVLMSLGVLPWTTAGQDFIP